MSRTALALLCGLFVLVSGCRHIDQPETIPLQPIDPSELVAPPLGSTDISALSAAAVATTFASRSENRCEANAARPLPEPSVVRQVLLSETPVLAW